MQYTKWIEEGKPYDTLFYVERREVMVENPEDLQSSYVIADLCSTLRLIDIHILSKHQAWPISPEEVIDSWFDIKKPDWQDHRRLFYVEKYGGDTNLVTVIARQYYDTHED